MDQQFLGKIEIQGYILKETIDLDGETEYILRRG